MMSMEEKIVEGVGNISQRILVLGIVLAVVGVICLVVPFQTGKAISVILGVFLIIGGFIRALFAFIGLTMGSTFFRFLFGFLMIIAGVLLVSNPDAGLQALTVWLSIYFLVDGIVAVIYSFELRRFGGGGWVLLDGIMAIVLAIMIWKQWPFAGESAIGILLGIKLLLDGGALIGLGFAGRSLQKAAK